MEVPSHKRAEHETIQAQIDEFLAKGKTPTKAKQGQIKPHLAKPYTVSNKSKLKLNEGKL